MLEHLRHLIRAPILVRVNHLKKKTLFKFLVKINFTSRLSRSNQQPIQPSKNIINNNHENLSSVTDLLRNSRNAINHLTAITPELTNHEKYSSKRKWILEERVTRCLREGQMHPLAETPIYKPKSSLYIVNSLIKVFSTQHDTNKKCMFSCLPLRSLCNQLSSWALQFSPQLLPFLAALLWRAQT